jgi:hypothetical protein
VACQEHSRATLIETVPGPPVEPNEERDELTVASQRVDVVEGLAMLVEVELPQPIANSAQAAAAAIRNGSRTTPARAFTPQRNAGKSPAWFYRAWYNGATPAEQL